jgi:hypothetical protein
MPSLFGMIGLRGAFARVIAAHEGEFVLPTLVVAWPGSDRRMRSKVIAMVVDEAGISLRDRDDAEVALLPADGILSIELAPLTRSAFRPLRVATLGHGTVDLALSQVRPDEQIDVVLRVRAAVGRSE